MTQQTQQTLLLVDGSSYLYRAYFAIKPLTAPDGTPTNAVYGVLKMLRSLRDETPHDFCACVFDAKGNNFRHEIAEDYKATRPPMPDDLRPQADMLPDLVELMGWKVLKVAGVEADDVIGTLAQTAQAQGMKVVISTGDKDMAQLVNENITLVNTMKNETLDENGVFEKFGVRPNQIRDYLALVGDKVDNVAGVDKCGEKTAVKWLAQYDSLANIMRCADEFSGKVGENLRSALEYLPTSYQLVTIKTDVDLQEELPQGLDNLKRQEPNWQQLVGRFQELGFKTWLKEAQAQLNTGDNHQDFDLFNQNHVENNTKTTTRTLSDSRPLAIAPASLNYQSITQDNQLVDLLEKLSQATLIGLDTETTSIHAQEADLIGISIAFGAGEAAYIPLGHGTLANPVEQLDLNHVLSQLKPFLENPNLKKVGQNLKYDQHVFKNYQIDLKGIYGDSMLASYILESHLTHNLDDLAQRWLGLETITYESLCGKGAKAIPFSAIDIARATEYACQDADFALRLEAHLRAQMDEQQLELYEKMELPVAHILFEMERQGVLLDKKELHKQSNDLGLRLMELEKQAYEVAGQPFNLNSPKQLQEILFDKMAIPIKGLKKTTTGGVSTNEAVLEQLAPDYELPRIILENRSLAKLKSTYTDKLAEMVNPKTGRIHTNFAQAVVITGRLASNNPNLQNIPIRTEEGRRVRKAFIAPEGKSLISADYSQIELRIMAHLSGDATLIESFQKGEDVHKRTASEVFGVAPENVSADQRRYAKTINFGLIYGMGEYGLAKSLGIDTTSAKMFIQRYFARYQGVAQYMQRAREQALEQGFVETVFGRRLYLPEIHSKNAKILAGAERAAINAPMQGTASDLIKRAMIDVFDFIQNQSLETKLLLQVHDELILEVPEKEVDFIRVQLPQIMSQVDKGRLNVPLLAEVGVGKNWDEAH